MATVGVKGSTGRDDTTTSMMMIINERLWAGPTCECVVQLIMRFLQHDALQVRTLCYGK